MYWRVMSRMRAVLRWQYVLESDVQNEGSDAPYPSTASQKHREIERKGFEIGVAMVVRTS